MLLKSNFGAPNCSDTLAENLIYRKFSETELYSSNLLTDVGFMKMLADLLFAFQPHKYCLPCRKRKELVFQCYEILSRHFADGTIFVSTKSEFKAIQTAVHMKRLSRE